MEYRLGGSGEKTSPYQRRGKNTFQENATHYIYRKKWKKDNFRDLQTCQLHFS